MKYLFTLLILTSSNLKAQSFKISGESFEFQNKDGLLVKGCEKSCEALKKVEAHKEIDLSIVRKGLQFAGSIGSDVCARVYQAQSVLGLNENRDGRAFCYFSDESMIEINSLSNYLSAKKYVK